MKKTILFICTHNSARSQMAEGLVNYYYSEYFQAKSAGTIPTMVNPYALAVMKELGIDISHQRSKPIEEFRNKTFDIVVTVCDSARETCPFFPGKIVLHRGFEDPS
ncbi:MAG: arsenate reductase ArsC, partial [Spirochaetes bacterium]